jgi:hypothetical protein
VIKEANLVLEGVRAKLKIKKYYKKKKKKRIKMKIC